MNAYNDLDTLKNRLQLATGASVGSTFDTELRKLLEAASRAADRLTNRRFYAESGTRYFRGDSRRLFFVDDVLSITSLKSDWDGDGTYEDSLTENTDYYLHPLNRFPKSWAEMASLSNYSGFSTRPRGVEVVGVFGYGNGRSATPYSATSITVTVGSATGTTLTLSAEGTIAAGHTILVESEQMYISSVTSDGSKTATAVRGVNGTTATAHSAKTASIYDYPEDLMEVVLIQAYKWWEEKNVGYQGVMKSAAGDTAVATQRGFYKDFLTVCKSLKRHNI